MYSTRNTEESLIMESNVRRWTGCTAFVTGGNSGIGAAIVRQLVDVGVNVVSFDKNTDKLDALANELLRAKGKGKLYPIKGDLRNEEDVLSAFAWVEENLGVVHVLVNNAGCGDGSTLLDGDSEHWRRVLDVNVLAVAVCTREALKSMRAHGFDEGHIFNIDSICGHGVLLYTSPMYTASKHAVTALTQTLRKQLSANKSKIRVTAINPGLVKTPLTALIPEEIMGTAPLLPSDIAGAILYALSLKQHVQVPDLTIVSEKEFDGKAIDDFTLSLKETIFN